MSATLSPVQRPAAAFVVGKIQACHLNRLALVYVRQSTLQQVERHQESTRLQYALTERAVALGWAPEHVEVIDDDLGRSGASAEGRPGFQRLMSEVSLDHVGLVLGIESSRLACSSRDWYQLLEVCALFSTLIGDADGLYDPQTYNDRLLLGLKGTMSEAELHILKQRMLEGKRAKARRGELKTLLPMGYVRAPSGAVSKDPDAQARGVIETIFVQFQRCATINGVLRYLVEHQLQRPYRVISGPQTGQLQWRRPNRVTLSNLLHNPTYAGAYVYGRRPTDPRRRQPGRPSTGRTVTGPEQWEVLLKDRLPAYISWAQYEANLRQLAANTAQAGGVARQGPSLLSGRLVCGRCGLSMVTQYTNNAKGLRYSCSRDAVDDGAPRCQSLSGTALDALITRLVLDALQPAALEISLQVADDLDGERARHHAAWQQRLERARYEAERAERQYHGVEPEHRLVARTLEAQWEAALSAETHLKADDARFLANEPQTLSETERARIRALAADIPALWKAKTTTDAERQAIVRLLIERVIVTVIDDSERVAVEVHWIGGHHTRTHLMRPVARLEQLSDYPQLLARVLALHQAGQRCTQIAEQLNAEGWRPAKRRATFNGSMVANLLAHQGLPAGATHAKAAPWPERDAHEWSLPKLARTLEMPAVTLFSWLRKGWLQARQVPRGGHQQWLIWADDDELAHLRSRRQAPRRWVKQTESSAGASAGQPA
ncbi:MAG: recombinase family protein [Chromatiaceae bacterium]|nr:recombinase family protein [Chromatiaceae bacterium]MCF8016608.1 recombinase family protein [Chromatiaceae bacterium]